MIVGGIDDNGMKEGETMSYIKTVNTTIWSLQFEDVEFFGHYVDIKKINA